MKKRILIVEDEPIIARDLSYMLEDLDYEISGIVHSAEKGIQHLQANTVDFVLLDINLEGDLTGIDLAHWINQKQQLPFVFLTSYSDKNTLAKAKLTEPYGYLVKPIDEQNLKTTLEIAQYNYQIRVKAKLTKEEENFWLENEFFIRHKGELVKVSVDSILFAEANDNYTLIHTKNQKFIVSATLKKVEEKLSALPFCRIHRSYLVNLGKISKVSHDDVYIQDHCLPISKKYREDFYKQIATF